MQTALAGKSQLQMIFFLIRGALLLMLGGRFLSSRLPKAQNSELNFPRPVLLFHIPILLSPRKCVSVSVSVCGGSPPLHQISKVIQATDQNQKEKNPVI